jgi:hypothetical protein
MVDTLSQICPALRVCRVANAAEVVSALDEAVRCYSRQGASGWTGLDLRN